MPRNILYIRITILSNLVHFRNWKFRGILNFRITSLNFSTEIQQYKHNKYSTFQNQIWLRNSNIQNIEKFWMINSSINFDLEIPKFYDFRFTNTLNLIAFNEFYFTFSELTNYSKFTKICLNSKFLEFCVRRNLDIEKFRI